MRNSAFAPFTETAVPRSSVTVCDGNDAPSRMRSGTISNCTSSNHSVAPTPPSWASEKKNRPFSRLSREGSGIGMMTLVH